MEAAALPREGGGVSAREKSALAVGGGGEGEEAEGAARRHDRGSREEV